MYQNYLKQTRKNILLLIWVSCFTTSLGFTDDVVPVKPEKKQTVTFQNGVTDPQLMTDHPLYKGELSCSTFERLFATQSEQYTRMTGRKTDTAEDKAIASWFWRGTHYFHCSLIPEPNIFPTGKPEVTRDYWAGLFSYGFSMCQENHYQYTAEIEHLLGHAHCRAVGLGGHTSFEVWLSGQAYGKGKWVLLDQDITTILFDKEQKTMMNIEEIMKIPKNELTNRKAKENRGWIPELYPGDGGLYYSGPRFWAPLSGYVCAPPTVNLRPGESLKRFPRPGFGDSTNEICVFWGPSPDGVVGPNRHTSYTENPNNYFNATARPKNQGVAKNRARFGNAVFTYKPNFTDQTYKAGVVTEDESTVIFHHISPYIIAVKPLNKNCTEAGATLGLVLNGKAICKVSVSLDGQNTFSEPVDFTDGLDLSDLVKGHYQYWLKFLAPAKDLANKDITITTRCMANGFIMPQLKGEGTQITFNSSNQAVETIGPQADIVRNNIIEGGLDKSSYIIKLKTPRGEKINSICWATRTGSGTPPKEDLAYKAEYSFDGIEWKVLADKWKIQPPPPYDPPDTWSQSFFYGSKDISKDDLNEVQVKISNNKGRTYIMGQFSLLYDLKSASATKVTYCWEEDGKEKTESHTYLTGTKMDSSWKIATGNDPKFKWVEMEAVKQ
jgi:hypothetical protein